MNPISRCRWRFAVAVLALASGLAAVEARAADAMPPAAPLQAVVDTLHGTKIVDPYRGLENLRSPATAQWLEAQGRYAAEQLAHINGRDEIQARITELSNASGDNVRSVVRLAGGQVFYLKRRSGEAQFKLMMRERLDAAERVLVDPEVQAKATGVPHAINYYTPSWDGRSLAYGVSAAGSEDASLMLLDVRSGKPIGEAIPRVPEGSLVSWAPDSRSLTYNQLHEPKAGEPETEKYKDSTVYHLRPGQPATQARAIFGPRVNAELALDRLDVGGVIFDPASRLMLVRTTDTTLPEGKLFVAPVAALNAPRVAWRQISSAADKITAVELKRDRLWLRTYAGAPRGRVLALNLTPKPDLKLAREVVPEPARGVLGDFSLGRDALYAAVRQGFSVRLLRFVPGSKSGRDVAPSLAGSMFATADPAHALRDVVVATSTWTEPPRLLRIDAAGAVSDTGLRQAGMPAGAPALQVTEVEVPSHDGALVPLAIIHKKGLVLDGSNPTLLDGYGAYGLSYDAWFDPRSLAWMERGGVMAYANVRGSGAFGDPWYRAGFKATKPNTWKDGIACARYLIDKGYASPKTLGIWGTSAGGIFVGRAVTAAPELFAAAIFDVGIMDAVRAEESANGATNTSEFGTVKKADEFRGLLEMSTYHHIQDGTAYPAVLLIHGLNDPRVDVWHSAKAAARLQAASSSGKPILLRLDDKAGHGVGSTAQQVFSERADIYSFLLWQMGKLRAAP
jgi:prolyl oligopeptidase